MAMLVRPPSRKNQTTGPEGENAARQRIVAGARRHFFAHGFRGVTMDDLAEELGMSKKTLYAHFPSKTALLEAVIGDKLQRVEADLDRVIVGRLPRIFSAPLHAAARLHARAHGGDSAGVRARYARARRRSFSARAERAAEADPAPLREAPRARAARRG